MATSLTCPDRRDLERLARGQLPEAEVERLGRHVLTCSACAAALNSLQADDPFLSDLRAVPTELPANNPFIDRLVERLVQAPPDSTLVTSGAPITPGAPAAGGAGPAPALPGYEILGVLGRGGMGVVYQARQVKLDRLVAVKMILAGGHAGAEEVARFRSEAQAVARLRHPNVVQIHEVGEADGHPFFALEFVEAGTLAGRIREAPLPARAAAQLVETLARAMHHAHGQGIVHRDLKPSNVLLAADGTPKITDFGLAKHIDADAGRTPTGAILGTPGYMAPEQAAGKTQELGPAVDTYALGAILYELVTGRPPFRAETPLDTVLLVLHEEPVAPRFLQPKLPHDLETICLKCLEKEPARRYATAEALADDLRRFLDQEPIRARPTSRLERLGKWARRKPAAAALAGVSLLAALAVLASVALYARYEAQQAGIYQRQLKQIREQEEVRERISRTVLQAQRHEAAGRWEAAQAELAKAREALDALPDLRADELRAEVRRRLAVVHRRLGEQAQRRQARQRWQDFQAPYEDALFNATLFTGLDVAESGAKTRAAARCALAIYGLDGVGAASRAARGSARQAGPGARLEADRGALGAEEHARLVEACYELLLIWAEVEATPAPGRVDAAQQRQRAGTALTLLARAACLGRASGLKTRTFAVRQAQYLARARGELFDPRRIDPAAPAGPTGALDWFLKGLDEYRAGQFGPAAGSCAEVVRKQPQHFWARYVLALCYLRTGRWVDGKAQVTICIDRRPDLVWPRLVRGFAASELGYKLADEQAAAAEFQSAAEDFDRALKQDRGPLVQYVGLANRGVMHIRRRHWAEAVADLRQAVRVNPAGFQAYVNLAQALQGQGRPAQALAALDRAIGLRPDLAVLYESRARLHLLRRDWATARVDFEQAVAREPRDGRSERLAKDLMELGRLLHREHDYPAALARYDQALRLRPELMLIQRFRAETLLALDRPAEAGLALDRYLAGAREVPARVYRARGLIHAALKHLPAAIEMYTLALRQDPTDVETRCHRGWAHLLTDAVRPAVEDFEACLRRAPADAEALIGRGNARVLLKQIDGALADARAAEKHGPLTDRQLYNLACLYAQAAGQLEAEARTPRLDRARRAAQQQALHQEKALDVLQQALEKLPPEGRAGFWRRQVEADPALKPIRRGSRYAQLAAHYAGTEP